MVIGIRMWTSAILPLRGGRFEFVVFEFVIVDYCGSVESEIVPGAALHPRLYSAACDSGLRSTRVCVPPFSVAMSSGVHCDIFDEPSLRTNSARLGSNSIPASSIITSAPRASRALAQATPARPEPMTQYIYI